MLVKERPGVRCGREIRHGRDPKTLYINRKERKNVPLCSEAPEHSKFHHALLAGENDASFLSRMAKKYTGLDSVRPVMIRAKLEERRNGIALTIQESACTMHGEAG